MNATARNATARTGMVRGLMLLSAGLPLIGGVNAARADRVRVAASWPGVSFDVGPRHGVVAVGTMRPCPLDSPQVFREPSYEWREYWVEIPAVVEHRRVAEYSHCGRFTGYRYVEVVVAPARRELRRERVPTRAGYYETAYPTDYDRPGWGFGVSVVPDDRYVVINKRPAITHVHRVYRGPGVVPVRHGHRPHRGGVQVRIDR